MSEHPTKRIVEHIVNVTVILSNTYFVLTLTEYLYTQLFDEMLIMNKLQLLTNLSVD